MHFSAELTDDQIPSSLAVSDAVHAVDAVAHKTVGTRERPVPAVKLLPGRVTVGFPVPLAGPLPVPDDGEHLVARLLLAVLVDDAGAGGAEEGDPPGEVTRMLGVPRFHVEGEAPATRGLADVEGRGTRVVVTGGAHLGFPVEVEVRSHGLNLTSSYDVFHL